MNLENPFRVVEYIMMFIVLFYTIAMLAFFFKYRARVRSTDGGKAYRAWRPFVSVVIPAYNEKACIGRCLESLLNVNYPKDRMEIIVVNDGSTDGTADVVRSFNDSRVRLLNKQNEGNAAYSKNYGIRHARGEVIITLDADSWVTPNSISNVLKYFDDDVAAVTAAVKVDRRHRRNFIGRLQEVEYLFTLFNRRLFSFINGVWVTPGPLSAFRRQVFDEVGLFDPKNIMEDQEMALRIQAANYRIASCTDAVVYTAVPQTLGELYCQRLRWNRGGIRNILHYRFLAKPGYGDFGLFVMPISIASIFLLLAVLGIVAFSTMKTLTLVPLNYDFLLAFEPIHVFSVIVLSLTGLWTVLSLKALEKRFSVPTVIAYMIIYSYMISFFTIVALAKEIKGEALRW